MRLNPLITALPFLPLLLPGCATQDFTMSAEDEITYTTISGEEEEAISGDDQFTTSDSETDAGIDRPGLFRTCDSAGTREMLLDRYDLDGDGELGSDDEEEAVFGERGDRSDHFARRRAMRWHRIELIYDTDEDGELSKDELAVLLDDFTVRCEAIHERLLAEYDADGDGLLSKEERAQLEADMEARRAEREAAMEERRAEGRDGMDRGGRGPGAQPSRSGELPRFLVRWDLDDSGDLDDAEMDTMRDDMRELIRSGEPMGPCNRDRGRDE